MASCFSSNIINYNLFHGIFRATLFTIFLCVLMETWLFKMALGYSDEFLSSVAKHKKSVMSPQARKYTSESRVTTICITVLLAVSSTLVYQQCISNNMPFIRNTQKTKLCADWLIKML